MKIGVLIGTVRVETATIHIAQVDLEIIIAVVLVTIGTIGIAIEVQAELAEAVVVIVIAPAEALINGIFGMATASKIVAVAKAQPKPHQLHLISKLVRPVEAILQVMTSTTKTV